MSKIDREFNALTEKILKEGSTYINKNRSTTRLQIPSYTFRHSFEDGFPAISSKRLAFKSVVGELIWLLSGSSSINYLKENSIPIWNKDAEVFDAVNGTCVGKSYGYQWRTRGGIPDCKPMKIEPFEIMLSEPPLKTFNDKIYEGLDIISEPFLKKNHKIVQVRFKDSGYICNTRLDRINSKKDPYKPNFRGVACMGVYDKESLNLDKIKNIWKGMISRCYNIDNENYKYYGGRGVSVSNRWKCFEFFLEDISLIEGWNLKFNDWDNFNLDKDIIGDGFLYSKDTCIWLSKSDNTRKSKNKYTYTIAKGSREISFSNISEVVGKFIRNQGNLGSLLSGKRNYCEGWHLKSKEKNKNGVDQIDELVKGMKKDIMSSRLKVEAWNPSDSNEISLVPCHTGFQIIGVPLGDDEFGFELHWNQRSVDVFLGLPFNIASYAVLAKILEEITGFKALGIQGDLKCVHLYGNSIEAAMEQVERPIIEQKSNLIINRNIEDVNDLDLLEISNFELEGYTSHKSIKVEMLAPNEVKQNKIH